MPGKFLKPTGFLNGMRYKIEFGNTGKMLSIIGSEAGEPSRHNYKDVDVLGYFFNIALSLFEVFYQ